MNEFPDTGTEQAFSSFSLASVGAGLAEACDRLESGNGHRIDSLKHLAALFSTPTRRYEMARHMFRLDMAESLEAYVRIFNETGYFMLTDKKFQAALHYHGLGDIFTGTVESLAYKGVFEEDYDENNNIERRTFNSHYVFINSIPKSASEFFAGDVCRQLEMGRIFQISTDGFPENKVIRPKAEVLVDEGWFCKSHLAGTGSNRDALADCGLTRIFILVRDPRQTALSMIHHLDRFTALGLGDLAMNYLGGLPLDFTTWEFSKKLEWAALDYVPATVQWINEWVAAASGDPRLSIMFCDYEQIRNDPVVVANALMGFLEIDYRFETFEIPQKGRRNFRSGDPDEWRRVFPQPLQERMPEAIPAGMMGAFSCRP